MSSYFPPGVFAEPREQPCNDEGQLLQPVPVVLLQTCTWIYVQTSVEYGTASVLCAEEMTGAPLLRTLFKLRPQEQPSHRTRGIAPRTVEAVVDHVRCPHAHAVGVLEVVIPRLLGRALQARNGERSRAGVLLHAPNANCPGPADAL